MPEHERDESAVTSEIPRKTKDGKRTRQILLHPSNQSERPDRHRPQIYPGHWRADSCIPLVSEVASKFQARRCLYEDVYQWRQHPKVGEGRHTEAEDADPISCTSTCTHYRTFEPIGSYSTLWVGIKL